MPSNRKPFRLILAALLVAGSVSASLPSLAVDSGGGGGGGGPNTSATAGPSLADARAAIRGQKWKAAIAILRKIVANEPRNADALNLLGYSLRKSGDHKNALGFYLKALKVNPKHKGANEYLGELYVETGQLAKARERLKALEAICGNTNCEEYEDLAKAINAAG